LIAPVLRKKGLPFPSISILRNHLINDLSTENASPAVKLSLFRVEFLINHFPTAAMTPHTATPVTSFLFDPFGGAKPHLLRRGEEAAAQGQP
jgi:hypothetical protein